MTEIKKITKITLIWYGVAGILFAFLYIVFTDFYIFGIMQWPYNDLVSLWLSGSSMLFMGIASLLAVFKKDWDEIKLFFLFAIMWLIGPIIINIVAITLLSFPATPRMSMMTNIVILFFNLVLGTISWIKQRS